MHYKSSIRHHGEHHSPLKATWAHAQHLVCLPKASKTQHGHTAARPETTFIDKAGSDQVTWHRSKTSTPLRTVSRPEDCVPACWLPKTDLKLLDKYSIFISLSLFIPTHARDVANSRSQRPRYPYPAVCPRKYIGIILESYMKYIPEILASPWMPAPVN